MNMIKKLIAMTLLTAATASVTTVASAQNMPPSTTFEVLIRDFRMAETAIGVVGFKQCDECEFQRLRLTARTVYAIDGRSLRFIDFREALAGFRENGNGELNINVKRDDASGTAASVFVYTQ